MIGVLFFCFIMCYSFYSLYKRKGLTASTALYALYALSGISSVVLVYVYDYQMKPRITDYFTGFVYLAIALLIYLYPFKKVRDNNFASFSMPKDSIFNLLAGGLCVVSLFSLLYFVPLAIQMLSVNVADVAEIRQMVAMGENPLIAETIYNTIAGTAASFYSVLLLFFFMAIIRRNKITLFAYLMLIGSFSYPAFVLAYMGRDGMLFWGFSFVFNYLLFRKFLPENLAKNLKKIAIRIGAVFGFAFVFITVGRFLVEGISDNAGKGVLYPFFNYMGQQSINFTELFSTDLRQMNYMQGILPLIFGEPMSKEMTLETYGLVSWVFRTFVNTIYTNFGTILTLLIGLFLNILFSVVNRKNTTNFSFSFLILYTLFITIYSQGVFYFRLYNRVGNLYIIVMLVFAFLALFFPVFRLYRTTSSNNL